jgi:hypothetical protein
MSNHSDLDHHLAPPPAVTVNVTSRQSPWPRIIGRTILVLAVLITGFVTVGLLNHQRLSADKDLAMCRKSLNTETEAVKLETATRQLCERELQTLSERLKNQR